MPKATENNSTGAERAIYGPKTTTFERAWRRIEAEAAAGHKLFSPRAAARLYLLSERAAGDARNDDALDRLGELSTSRIERIAETRSRDIGDVAAKLAALVVENGQNGPVQSGGLEAAIHAGMCSCLADLVILSDGPLPDASAVLDMRAQDFELRDMTAAEAAQDRAEPARDGLERRTIEGDRLKSSLAGWHETLLALRDLAQKRPIKADAFDPLLTEIGGMFDELDPIETRGAGA